MTISIIATDSETCGSVDVTEAVQALYDLAIHSMDFGSGFWSAEDARPVAQLAAICGFEQREEVEKYIDDRDHEAQGAAWLREHYDEVGRPYSQYWGRSATLGHEHVYSTVGRCMWPGCRNENTDYAR